MIEDQDALKEEAKAIGNGKNIIIRAQILDMWRRRSEYNPPIQNSSTSPHWAIKHVIAKILFWMVC